jgi:hypothetical protein
MGLGRAVGNQVECRPVPVSLLRRLGGVGSAAAVEDGADGIDSAWSAGSVRSSPSSTARSLNWNA